MDRFIAAGSRYTGARVETPLGWVGVVGSEQGLVSLILPRPDPDSVMAHLPLALSCMVDIDDNAFPRVAAELRRYFAGEVVHFSATLDQRWGTPFQQAVWKVVAAIPYGQVVSYGEVARQVGKPGAARAVGGAVGANPLPIIVPCHRVVTAQGQIGGFSGGIGWKRRLLDIEGIRLGTL